MANIKISALPSQTATTDNDLLVIVDSGLTQTSKITKADFLSGSIPTPVFESGTGSDSIRASYLPAANAGGQRSFSVGASANADGQNDAVLGGDSNTVNSGGSAIVAGFGNSIGGLSYYSFMGGGRLSSLGNSSQGTALVGTRDSAWTNTPYGFGGGIANVDATGAGGTAYGASAIGSKDGILNYAEQSGLYSTYESDILGTSGNNVKRSFIMGGTGNTINNNTIDSGILGGNNNTLSASANRALLIGGSSSTISSTGDNNSILGGLQSQIGAGSRNTVIGGELNNISNGNASVVIGGRNGRINGGAQRSFIGGGFDNLISSNGDYVAIVGGAGNTISKGSGNIIAGGSSGSISSTGSYNFIGGGSTNTINGGSQTFILGGTSNTSSATNFGIIGGQGNTASGRGGSVFSKNVSNGEDLSLFYVNGGTYVTGNAPGKNIVVVGGADHYWNTNASGYGGIFGGYGNKNRISNGGTYQGIVSSVGGFQNWFGTGTYAGIGSGDGYMMSQFNSANTNIGGSGVPNFVSAINTNASQLLSSTGSTIVGGDNVVVSGKTGVVALGLNSRTALYDETTHVENIHTYKTETFSVIDAGNVGGNIDVDCSLGTIFTFTMTANTTPNFINLRSGQRFIFIVENAGAYSVPTATVEGVSSTVYSKNGTLNPTNSGYTKYTATYVNGILWLDEELNFQAV